MNTKNVYSIWQSPAMDHKGARATSDSHVYKRRYLR